MAEFNSAAKVKDQAVLLVPMATYPEGELAFKEWNTKRHWARLMQVHPDEQFSMHTRKPQDVRWQIWPTQLKQSTFYLVHCGLTERGVRSNTKNGDR